MVQIVFTQKIQAAISLELIESYSNNTLNADFRTATKEFIDNLLFDNNLTTLEQLKDLLKEDINY